MNTTHQLIEVSINGMDHKTNKEVETDTRCRNPFAATTLPQNPEPERRELRVEGQVWWLTKRSLDPDAKFHLQGPARNGQRCRQALHHSSVKDAEAEAKVIIKKWNDGWRNPVKVVAPTCATVAELEAAFYRLTIDASPKTRHNYLQNLRRCLVRAVDVPAAGVASVRLDALTDAAGARLFAWVDCEALKQTGQAAQNRLRGSWLSMFHSSLALFAKRPLYQLKALGLVMPDMKGWREAALHHGPRLPRSSGAAVPDDAIVRKTLGEWAKLGNTPGYVCRNHKWQVREDRRTRCVAGPLDELARRNMFLAIGLELSCGLRKGDAPKARWDWVKRFSGVPHLSELNVDVKNHTGQIHVVPVDPFWNFTLRVARRNGWIGEPADPWLVSPPQRAGGHATLCYSKGGPSHATVYPFDHIGWWLRDLGWEMQKTNHALRDYTASVITMRYGLSDACDWCRHSSLETTRQSYNRFVTLSGKISSTKYAWLRWAK